MNLDTAYLTLALHQKHLPRDPEGDTPIHVPRGKPANLSLTLYPEIALHLGSSSSQHGPEYPCPPKNPQGDIPNHASRGRSRDRCPQSDHDLKADL